LKVFGGNKCVLILSMTQSNVIVKVNITTSFWVKVIFYISPQSLSCVGQTSVFNFQTTIITKFDCHVTIITTIFMPFAKPHMILRW
jgi:hypothetical protein